MNLQLPDQAELKKTFTYNPDTGILYRKGKPVGCKGNGDGYTVRYKYKLYRVARIIWMIQTGEDPADLYIDHINRDPYDNRWENLRAITQQQNQMNRSGGNIYVLPSGSYRVQIGKAKVGRTFENLIDAEKWRDEMKKKLFGEFACLDVT